VLHALELAGQDLRHWCGDLDEEQLNASPKGLPSVGFHIRHIARSLDRLLTYAEGSLLNNAQMKALKAELSAHSTANELFTELDSAMASATRRVRTIDPARLEEVRTVGRGKLPTTLGGLLVHVADHTQRHVGQAITTAKFLKGK
jgi:uncharacterized damage-inducible protein DinB